MRERRDKNGIFIRKLEGKKLLGRPKYRWENNIKAGLQEIE
jgi:hypothetical protein